MDALVGQETSAIANEFLGEKNAETLEVDQVRVRFISDVVEYRLPEEVNVTIAVPTNLSRVELSDLIKQLLSSNAEFPFDFEHVSSGKLIRGTLAKFCERNGISLEDELLIKYFPRSNMPQANASKITADEWHSCVTTAGLNSNTCSLFVGSFEGKIENYTLNYATKNLDRSFIVETQSPIKSIASLGLDGKTFVATSHRDATTKIHSLANDNRSLNILKILSGHRSTVDSISICQSTNYSDTRTILATGSWDKCVNIYSIVNNDLSSDAAKGTVGEKRKQMSSPNVGNSILQPELILSEHADKVSSVKFIKSPSSSQLQLLSASNDNTIRLWKSDASRSDFVSLFTFNCRKVPTSLDFSEKKDVLLSAHTDGVIRCWDPRTTTGADGVFKFAVKTNATAAVWTSCVKFNSVSNEHEFVSGDFEGNVLLWDLRSPSVPIINMDKAHDGKVFGVEFDPKGRNIVSVGSDATVRVHGR